MTLTLTFTRERETKNTVRFQETPDEDDENAEAVVGTLYVQKTAVAHLGDPETLTVRIEAA